MENGKRTMENEERSKIRKPFSASAFPLSEKKICSACGANIIRQTARFCNTCGKILFEDYEPLDNLRSSYNLQGTSFGFEIEEIETQKPLFEKNENQVAHTAWACLVYSMVPYLGILFIPFTFVIGGFGYAAAVRHPKIGGKKLALVSIGLSFVVLSVQMLLWWLLYIVPKLGRQF